LPAALSLWIEGDLAVLDNLFQPTHLLVILFIALLVFGPKKLPELGKGLGEGIRSFRESMNAKDDSASKKEEKKP
jgi:sec-independent protein translocase protein TatA